MPRTKLTRKTFVTHGSGVKKNRVVKDARDAIALGLARAAFREKQYRAWIFPIRQSTSALDRFKRAIWERQLQTILDARKRFEGERGKIKL